MLFFFFFNDTATTEIYTLSLHDALPIWMIEVGHRIRHVVLRPVARVRDEIHVAVRHPLVEPHVDRAVVAPPVRRQLRDDKRDRKSTRLNSSHDQISYAVFCLKKKNRR